jgi:DNA polymerase/3'-5' exonuclease PolX
MIPQIIESFQALVDHAKATKEKGWQFKIKNYQKAIVLLQQADLESATFQTVGEAYCLFRDRGWTLKGEPYREDDGYGNRSPKSAILKKIHEILTTGKIDVAEAAKQDPRLPAIRDLCRIPGIGPAKANALYDQGITSIQELRDRVALQSKKAPDSASGQVELTAAQSIGLRHLEDLELRIPREQVDQWQEVLNGMADALSVAPENRCVVGSYRRGKPDSGDVDFYVSIPEQARKLWMKGAAHYLKQQGILKKKNIISIGEKKMMMVASLPGADKPGAGKPVYRHIDIFAYPHPQFPFAILHATGSRDFNILLRKHALDLGWSLSEHGLKSVKEELTGVEAEQPPPTHMIQQKIQKPHFTEEKDIFRFLDYDYVQPQDR